MSLSRLLLHSRPSLHPPNQSKPQTLAQKLFLSSQPPPPPTKNLAVSTDLTKAPPGLSLPKHIFSQSSTPPAVSQVTKLSNGIRVASEPKFGQYCTVGICIDSGSRYEAAYPSGVSHFLEKLSFGVTEKFGGRDDIMQRMEKFGGIFDCQTHRDTALYAASVDSRGLQATVEILADVVLRPKLLEEEIDYARMAVNFELEDAVMRPDQEPLMMEAIHKAAYWNNTVGLPKMCPTENVNGSITQATLLNYLSHYYTPQRMVLAGVGVDHDELVSLAEEHLVNQKPAWNCQEQCDESTAQYTGGLVSLERDLSDVSLGPTPMPELAHIAIGLESVSHQHPDFIPFCVLNTLMGGGGSFSAGGPGKGMYTRLYTNVLNHYHWMCSCTAQNHAYADTGFFTITASGPPRQVGQIASLAIDEFIKLASAGYGETEFKRAKKQLQSMLLMNLESRPVVFEDLARQVLSNGERKQPEYYIERIEAVTGQDLHRVAERMLASKPSVAAIGSLDNLPPMDIIEAGLLDRNRPTTAPTRKMFGFRTD